MAVGLDSSVNLERVIKQIVQEGYHFAGRYYCQTDHPKLLTPSEARAISAAGVYIVALWKNGYPSSSGYFTYHTGLEDAQMAYNYAKMIIGQPAATPIYFAVDYDAPLEDARGCISEYFRGIVEGIKAATERHGVQYDIGIYGSASVCETVMNQFTDITYAWLSASPGWSDSREFEKWNLKQGPGTTVSGIDIETVVSNGNGGGFKIG
ncbi:DUF1906 domain-containing protein [Paenibacillus athensensis]|nr:glycoside hydrolase domain-containing protein [Paenibacillus athensensis]MCD1260702.1 DUF1906 domain-containing protein [Paenibacillus athensensis]